MGNILLSPAEAAYIKERLHRNTATTEALRERAEATLRHKLYSVTEYPSPAESGDIHDYFSEGPYWWPNPKDPQGPYIRRDGHFNPDLFEHHRADMTAMSKDALLLAIAAFYLDTPRYAERAYQILFTWFIDEKTRMNPNLEHAQAIRGLCAGRGIGIIDTVTLISAVQAAWYLEQLGYTENLSGCRAWFSDYLTWMNTSKKGLEEKHYFNNHSNWWNSQAAAYAAYTENAALLNECVLKFKQEILPGQMGECGEFIDEMKRANPFHYALYNLSACGVMCEIAHQNGVDLWHYATEDGKGMEKALAFIAPYLEHIETWCYGQWKKPEHVSENPSLQLGALRLKKPHWAAINRQNRIADKPLHPGSLGGPIYFLAGYDGPF